MQPGFSFFHNLFFRVFRGHFLCARISLGREPCGLFFRPLCLGAFVVKRGPLHATHSAVAIPQLIPSLRVRMKFQLSLACLVASGCLLLSGCNFDFPLTAKPTRKLEARLLGDWVAVDNKNPKEEFMQVRQLDDFTFVVAFDHDIYRAFHSDFADTAFLSVQDLNSSGRKYLYFTWQLSADGEQLILKGVSTKVVPEATKTPADIRRLIKQNLTNPKLFGDEIPFTRKKPDRY